MDNLSSLVPIIIAFVFVGLAAIFFVLTMRARTTLTAAAAWQSASATIVESDVEARYDSSADGGTSLTYYPVVRYDYEVNGQRYRGDKRVIGSEIGKGFKGWAQRDLTKYPRGAVVPVFYNPADPREAVLERSSPQVWFFNAMAGLFVVISLCMCSFYFGMGGVLDAIFGPQ